MRRGGSRALTAPTRDPAETEGAPHTRLSPRSCRRERARSSFRHTHAAAAAADRSDRPGDRGGGDGELRARKPDHRLALQLVPPPRLPVLRLQPAALARQVRAVNALRRQADLLEPLPPFEVRPCDERLADEREQVEDEGRCARSSRLRVGLRMNENRRSARTREHGEEDPRCA